MNNRHRHTLARIYGDPTPADVRWSDVEALFTAVSAELSEGAGSRVRVALNGVRAVFHRPHPSPTLRKAAVRSVRDFLRAARVTPKEE